MPTRAIILKVNILGQGQMDYGIDDIIINSSNLISALYIWFHTMLSTGRKILLTVRKIHVYLLTVRKILLTVRALYLDLDISFNSIVNSRPLFYYRNL